MRLNSSEDSDEEEDETAQLLRELEKIKRERAEEQAKKEREQSEQNAASNEARIASANPLLNLAAALGQVPAGLNTTAPGSFSVKKRWDDGESSAVHVKLRMVISSGLKDLIFKNQAMNGDEKAQGQFVNDLLRTEFHKCVIDFWVKMFSAEKFAFFPQKVHDKIHQGMILIFEFDPGLIFISVTICLYPHYLLQYSNIILVHMTGPSHILLLPIPASPSQMLPDWWYTLMHARRCIIFQALDLDAEANNILGNKDALALRRHLSLVKTPSAIFS